MRARSRAYATRIARTAKSGTEQHVPACFAKLRRPTAKSTNDEIVAGQTVRSPASTRLIASQADHDYREEVNLFERPTMTVSNLLSEAFLVRRNGDLHTLLTGWKGRSEDGMLGSSVRALTWSLAVKRSHWMRNPGGWTWQLLLLALHVRSVKPAY